MAHPYSSTELISRINAETTKLGDLKKLAKEIKKDHDLAMELWSSGTLNPRLLATLIMEKKVIDQGFVDGLINDLESQEMKERLLILDWLLANQLTKSKNTIQLLESWEKASSPSLRRLFWYHQARLRWTGQTPPDNTADLLRSLEKDMGKAEPEVQWAMNFTAAWIGVFQAEYRGKCVDLGENLGLYKDDPVPRGCTPDYLPEFIRVEVEKRA